MHYFKYNRKGLSLIELILSLTLVLIILQVTYSIFFSGHKSFIVSKDIGFSQQDARIVTSYIQNELKPIKNMYVDINETTEELDLSGEAIVNYYMIGLNEDNILTHYKSIEGIIVPVKTVGSKIFSLEFNPIKMPDGINNDKNIIHVIVVANENNIKKEYNFDIRFENDTVLDFPIDINKVNKIYYTKYE